MNITEQALRQAVNGGYRTLKDIGEDFSVTRQRIQQLCNRYGIKRPRTFDEYAPRTQVTLAPPFSLATRRTPCPQAQAWALSVKRVRVPASP